MPKIVNVTIRELILTKLTVKQQVDAVLLSIPRDNNGNYAENIDTIYLSWERFNRTASEVTIANEIGDLFSAAGLPRPTRAGSSDTVNGWSKMYDMLEHDDWYLLDTCPQSAEALQMLVRHPVKVEEVEKPRSPHPYNDIGDSLRYAVTRVLDEEDKPSGLKMQEELASISDPLTRHFRYKQIQKKYQNESKGMTIGRTMDWE